MGSRFFDIDQNKTQKKEEKDNNDFSKTYIEEDGVITSCDGACGGQNNEMPDEPNGDNLLLVSSLPPCSNLVPLVVPAPPAAVATGPSGINTMREEVAEVGRLGIEPLVVVTPVVVPSSIVSIDLVPLAPSLCLIPPHALNPTFDTYFEDVNNDIDSNINNNTNNNIINNINNDIDINNITKSDSSIDKDKYNDITKRYINKDINKIENYTEAFIEININELEELNNFNINFGNTNNNDIYNENNNENNNQNNGNNGNHFMNSNHGKYCDMINRLSKQCINSLNINHKITAMSFSQLQGVMKIREDLFSINMLLDGGINY